MGKGDYLAAILRSDKTVFSFKDIVLLWGETSAAARARLSYYVKKGGLFRVRRGLYVKNKKYNRFELASKIFTPAYVSFETVLRQSGMIFQHYSQIFAASYVSREIKCDGQKYIFRKMKPAVLNNAAGIEQKQHSAIASKERAFLDVLYLNRDYYFDNLSSIDWKKVFEILPIYNNKNLEKRVKEMRKKYKNELI